MQRKARVLAMYLPQYHPIPENDAAWGKGFTEWTNVAQARPLFWGHYQPKIPADLGFYDLRMPEVREAQAEMAREAGIEGFMYWHYWFGNGKMLLERPFEEVLASGKPDFPFCLGWANHSWMTKTWKKGNVFQKNPMIMEQLYPGHEDHVSHFNYCLPAFKDKRYIKVDNKPVFAVFSPKDMPDAQQFTSTWQQLAKENGLPGIHFVGIRTSDVSIEDVLNMGFDAVNNRDMKQAQFKIEKCMLWSRIRIKLNDLGIPARYNYTKIVDYMLSSEDMRVEVYPTILSGYDRTARAGGKTVVYEHYNPTTFGEHVAKVIEKVSSKDFEHRIVFLKSWNEWGEGNYVEPDLKYGHGFLDALKKNIIG